MASENSEVLFGVPTDEEFNLMKKHIPNKNAKKEKFCVFENMSCGDMIIPSRNVRIMPELLQTMAADAKKGFALMLNHNWSDFGDSAKALPIGKVFDARIEQSGTQSGESQALYFKKFIPRNERETNGISSQSIIEKIEDGVLTDTSIGWSIPRENFICSVCNKEYYKGKGWFGTAKGCCDHWAGETYEIDVPTGKYDKDGKAITKKESKLCFIEAHAPKQTNEMSNTVMMEESLVFDGAYPNAQIQSAIGNTIKTDNGNLTLMDFTKKDLPENAQIYAISSKGNVAFMVKENPAAVNGNGGKEGKTEMDDNKDKDIKLDNAEEQPIPAEQPAADEASKIPTPILQSYTINLTVEQIKECLGIEADEKTFLDLAKHGLKYRSEIVEEALKNGIKAYGNDFDVEAYRTTFALMTPEQIKRQGEQLAKQSTLNLSGERVSTGVVLKKTDGELAKIDRTTNDCYKI